MPKRRLPPNVTAYRDRHGKERFRFRKAGFKPHTFKGDPGTATKPSDEYRAVAAGAAVAPGAERIIPGTIHDLITRFYRSAGFTNGNEQTRRTTRGILERFRAEHGNKRVAKVKFQHIEAILIARAQRQLEENGREIGGPGAAGKLKKHLRRVFAYAIKLEMIASNPVEQADGVKAPKTGGFHTWTEEEIEQYQAHHALGTKARLALEIILWTGQRRGDASSFGRKHLKGGRIKYRQAKGGKDIWLPAAPQLLEAIAAMPVTGKDAFLVTDYGKPFTKAGLGNKMREWCDEAGLPQCSAHGLRKAIARRLAEDGAGNQGIKSVGGWSGDAEVATYTAEVDQQRLADATLSRLSASHLARSRARDE